MEPGESDSPSIAAIIADHQDRAGRVGLKPLPAQAGEELVQPRGRTGPRGEQTPESEQDSEGKTLTAVTQRGKTPSVTQGLLPSAQWDSPHTTLAPVMGAVCPHRGSQADP